jgi:phosphoribosylaminoimidazolecarboxamide formyltransferase/IMP cyclohydrolase
MLDPPLCAGRVKTLHPGVHGGILAIRSNAAHMDAIKQHNIAPIDLVRFGGTQEQQAVVE